MPRIFGGHSMAFAWCLKPIINRHYRHIDGANILVDWWDRRNRPIFADFGKPEKVVSVSEHFVELIDVVECFFDA